MWSFLADALARSWSLGDGEISSLNGGLPAIGNYQGQKIWQGTGRSNDRIGDPAPEQINGDSLAVRNMPVAGPLVQDAPVRVRFTEKQARQATGDKGPKPQGTPPPPGGPPQPPLPSKPGLGGIAPANPPQGAGPADAAAQAKPQVGPLGGPPEPPTPKDQTLQEQALNSVEAAEALIRLAADPDPARGWPALESLNRVAENSTNEEVIRRLARLENTQLYNSVLFLVGRNRHTPPEVLQGLAATGDPFVLAEVAGNPRTPEWVLADLARYSAPGFSGASQRQLASTVHEQVAGNPSTPRQVLADLASHDDLRVQLHAARNRKTPAPALERLAAGTDEPALREAHEARLRRMPEELREQLREEFEVKLREVRQAALETLRQQAGSQGSTGPNR